MKLFRVLFLLVLLAAVVPLLLLVLALDRKSVV